MDNSKTAYDKVNELFGAQEQNEMRIQSHYDNLSKVESFHQVYGQKIRDKVEPKLANVSDEEIALRINLLIEEFKEYIGDGFGIRVEVCLKDPHTDEDEFLRGQIDDYNAPILEGEVKGFRDKINVVEIADAGADIEYILHGSSLTFGIDSKCVFNEVHCSNMTKLDSQGKPIISDGTGRFPRGKILKGLQYTKPNIKWCLTPIEEVYTSQ